MAGYYLITVYCGYDMRVLDVILFDLLKKICHNVRFYVIEYTEVEKTNALMR